jgi:hypothetical protein
MFTKKIKYTNYNGEEKEKKFYFNLSKAELLEMELSTKGGYENYINRIIEAEDQPELVRIFKELLLLSYGVKSDDGETFVKSDKLREEFQCTEAYSELFTELATNTEAATEFINGIIPAALQAEVQKEMARRETADNK